MECHWWTKCPHVSQACTWDTAFDWHDCQQLHAICMRNGQGQCRWSHSRSYRECTRRNKAEDKTRKATPTTSTATPLSRWSSSNTVLLHS